MVSNFDFLNKEFPELANFGRLAEQYCYSDANSCLIKLGMIGETMVNMIYEFDDIQLPYDNTAVKRIDKLLQEDFLTDDIAALLHGLRKARNKASHENYGTVDDSKKFLQIAHILCEWFMPIYGDYSYEHHEFVLPAEPMASQPVTVKNTAEKKKEEELLEKEQAKALAKAAKATKQPLEERKKKIKQISSKLVKTEAETRFLIDEALRKVGWEADTATIRYSKGTRPAKGHNYAIAEYPTDSKVGNKGYADYALFIGEKLVAIVEAKAMHKDVSSVIDYQGKDYAACIRDADAKYQIGTWGKYKVPFTFATNGRAYLEQYKTKSGIWFRDLRKPYNAPMALHGWMSPDGIEELLAQDIEGTNKNLQAMPYDFLTDKDGLNLREYQIKAIKAAEIAIIAGRTKILLAMATGTGKTRTVLGMIYRFLKTNRFHRILFLVDRTSLGEQAYDVFKEVKLEDLLTLDEIYNIKGLEDKSVEKDTRIHISTVQGMVKRIMYNIGDTMPAVSDYDLIIVDEAHRGYILDKEMTDDELVYRDQKDYQSKYRLVMDYFNAVKLGLTATPALQTTEIFGEPVFKYTYREAVIEGYLVDHDAPHALKTKLSTEGIHYKKGDTVTLYDPVTKEIINSEQLSDELDFDVEKFNRDVITESFNRTVLEEIAADLDPEFPQENGKTLIYAVNDAHADLIVSILKEIYAASDVDSNAIMKITGSVANGDKKKIQEAIKRFKNETYPSIVVTVDLLTTGIDVPEITTLVFMRRVKSRILFEQMLGRATRLCPEIHKTHFEIYDPVGVYDSLEEVNTMKPVVANPSVTFTQIIDELEENEDEAVIKYKLDQLIAKLQRTRRTIDGKAAEQIQNLSAGMNIPDIIKNLQKLSPQDAKKKLVELRPIFQLLQKSKPNGGKPVVISDAEDELVEHSRGYGNNNAQPKDYLDEFSHFINTNINEITALKIVCTRPSDLTRDGLKSLKLTLDGNGYTVQQLNTAISQLTNEEITADIISLIRRYAVGSALISHEARINRAITKLKKAHKFSKQEQSWLSRIEKYMLEESVLNIRVFDEDSRFKSKGGFTKINKVFQNKLESIVMELNEYLYDDGGQSA